MDKEERTCQLCWKVLKSKEDLKYHIKHGHRIHKVK